MAGSTVAVVDTQARQERRFALALFAPAFVLLLLITTAPLVFLAWNSLQKLDMGMPWLSGFAGLGNYTKMAGDPRFWNSLTLTVIYTSSTVVLQVIIGLSLALLVLQIPRGQAALRVAAILPIVLAPVVVGLFWRTLVLAPDFGLVDLVTRALGLGSHNWLGDPQLALISVIAIHTWQWTPFAFLVLLATLATLPPDVYEAARLDRASAWQRFWHITLGLEGGEQRPQHREGPDGDEQAGNHEQHGLARHRLPACCHAALLRRRNSSQDTNTVRASSTIARAEP